MEDLAKESRLFCNGGENKDDIRFIEPTQESK